MGLKGIGSKCIIVQINCCTVYSVQCTVYLHSLYQGELNTRRAHRVSVHFAVTFLDC